jgi:hypothetical protein
VVFSFRIRCRNAKSDCLPLATEKIMEAGKYDAGDKLGADAPAAAPAPAGATPSNTAPESYSEGPGVKVLLVGIDSLYLSYYGEFSPGVEVELIERKQDAQSPAPSVKAKAQMQLVGHIFEVSDKGQGRFAYVLQDRAYRICIRAGHTRSGPLVWAKISSEWLAHRGAETAVEELTKIVAELGKADQFPTVSRVDVFADFQTYTELEGFSRRAWVTRALSIVSYSLHDRFSGWTVGAGGPLSARLYDKTLEILRSKKEYFKELWGRAGWDRSRSVWRLEFQFSQKILSELGIRSFDGLLREVGGAWGYATNTWLRLAEARIEDGNRARWPTHPMWKVLSEIRWRLDDVPLTRKVSAARVPKLDVLFRFFASVQTSFMAVKGIGDYSEGLRRLVEESRAFLASRCEEVLGMTFEDWIVQEVAVKRRRFNTGLNIPSEGQDSATNDKVDRDAGEYFRRSKGE